MRDSERHLDPPALKSPMESDIIFDHQRPASQVAEREFKPRAAVYMLSANDKPILLATTANLKHAVSLRLGVERAPHKTDYHAITTHVSWRYVNSAFAASWWYLRASRQYYPGQYRSLLAWRSPWFLCIDMGGPHKPPTLNVQNSVGRLDDFTFGPLASRREASRLANWLLEQFDLCRFEDILRKSPRGQPCAYKEMGKCPAPCDGSVSMDAYRQAVQDAVNLLRQMAPMACTFASAADLPWYQQAAERMKQAAVVMNFRLAAKIKNQLQSLTDEFKSGPCGWGAVNQWRYMALQRGNTRRWIEPWIVRPGVCISLPPVEAKVAMADGAVFISQLQKQMNDLPLPPDIPPTETSLVDDVFALFTYHLNRSRDPGLYLLEADLENESATAHRVAQWLGQTDSSTVQEMASDASATSGSGDPDAASEGERI